MRYKHASFPGQQYSMTINKTIDEINAGEDKSAAWYMLNRQELENIENNSWRYKDKKALDDAKLSKII